MGGASNAEESRDAVRDSGYVGVSFIGSSKRILRRVLAERQILLTPEAKAHIDALPERFKDFILDRS